MCSGAAFIALQKEDMDMTLMPDPTFYPSPGMELRRMICPGQCFTQRDAVTKVTTEPPRQASRHTYVGTSG